MYSFKSLGSGHFRNSFHTNNDFYSRVALLIFIIIAIQATLSIDTTEVFAKTNSPTTSTSPQFPPLPPPPYVRTVQVEKTVSPGLDSVAEAKCSAGEFVTGGGFWVRPDLNGQIVYNLNVEILGSRPSENGHGWSVWLHNLGDKASYITFVLCAKFVPAQ